MSFHLNVRVGDLTGRSCLIFVGIFLSIVGASLAVAQEAPDDVRANDHFRVYAKLLLEKYDSDDDGFLSQAEMSEMSRPPSDKRFDLDGDSQLSLNEIVQAIERPSAPQIEEKTQPQDLNPKIEEKFTRYVAFLITTYDQNKDGYIDTQERKKMRRPWPASYDKNSDEKLSSKELMGALLSSESSKNSSRSADSIEETAKKEAASSWSLEDINLKFLEASLRKNDKNGNGQLDPEEITVAEWSRPDWRQSDTNRDGILSRDEMKRRYEQMFSERLAETSARQTEQDQQRESARQMMMQMMAGQRSQNAVASVKSSTQNSKADVEKTAVEIELYLLRLPEQASASSFNNAVESLKDAEAKEVAGEVSSVAKQLGIKQYDQSSFTATDRKPTQITSGATIPVTIASVQTQRGRQAQVQDHDVGLAVNATPHMHPDHFAVDFEISKSDVILTEADENEDSSFKVVSWVFQSTMQFHDDGLAVIGSSSSNQHWILVVKANKK